MKIRAFYTRRGDLKYISHLNTIDLLQRAVFYTRERIAFSEGFNPHPIMSFGNPLPLGVSSDLEVFDVEIVGDVIISEFIGKLNEYLPNEVQIVKAYDASDSPSISKIIKQSIYEFTIYSEKNLEDLEIDLKDKLIISRERKRKKGNPREFVREDISPHVKLISKIKRVGEDKYIFSAQLENSTEKIINPLRFIEGLFDKLNLEIPLEDVSIHKKDMK